MAGRNYERLGIEEFGTHLIVSQDLDPVYSALVAMADDGMMSHKQRARWLVAYWCWYATGSASWLSEQEGLAFWDAMMVAAVNEEPTLVGGRWPRGHERRHARGAQGIKMVSALRERYGSKPEDMVEYVAIDGSCEELMKRTKEHVLFGPWIGFKVADMAANVLGCEVDFSEAAVFMFKDPMKSAMMVWERHHGMPKGSITSLKPEAVHAVVEHLRGMFGKYDAPPRFERKVGVTEIETVLCKHKSHLNGAYPLWNDIDEIVHSVTEWSPHSHTARNFLDAMPRRREL